uniref:Single domain-containing protein n=1 Tax=Arion vulgaris TaxID=1028688 RepID=A0A0B6Y068_9EUPU
MNAVLASTLMVVMIATMVEDAHGALARFPGPCPGSYKPGDKWYLDACRQGVCYEDFYIEESCGVAYIEHDSSQCYMFYNRTQPYPTCCNPDLKCIGDVGFDSTQLVG